MSKDKVLGIYFADSHLDDHNWSQYPEAYGDSIWSFRRICQRAIEGNANYVVCAGDFFDKPEPPSVAIKAAREVFDSLQAEKIQFYFIQGQATHDRVTPPWATAIHSWPIHLCGADTTIGPHRLFGLDWTPAAGLQDALKSVPKDTGVLVMHQVWKELMGELRHPEGSWTQVPHTKFLFTGDYHKTVQNAVAGATQQGMLVISPGSTNMRSITEPAAKYFFWFDGQEWTEERIPTRPRLKVVWRSEDGEDAVKTFLEKWPQLLRGLKRKAKDAGLPRHLTTPLVHITHSPQLYSFRRRIADRLAEQAFLFWKREADQAAGERPDVSSEERREMLALGVEHALGLMMADDDPRKEPLADLLSAARRGGGKVALAALRTKMLKLEQL